MPNQLRVNGATRRVDASPDKPLLWVLREDLGLTGTKFGCGSGQCGACTVLIDGEAVRSCTVPLRAARGAILTIEGVYEAEDPAVAGLANRLRETWAAEQVTQCGYCQPGMIMAVIALLRGVPPGGAPDWAAGLTNLCRCGTYPRIRRALARLTGPA